MPPRMPQQRTVEASTAANIINQQVLVFVVASKDRRI
jgi:hypothetical protein